LLFLFGDYSLDTDRRELHRAGALVPAEPQVFDILEHLIRNRSRVVTKDELLAAVWNGRIVSDSALTTRINAVRAAVGDTGSTQSLIRTLRRKGIRFVGDVTEQGGDNRELINGTSAAPTAEIVRKPVEELAGIADKPSLAVLPFAYMGGDPEQEYFADGIVEDIITALSRFRSFVVIAGNSSFVFKGLSVDVRQIAAELGVRYVLEGSIRRSGDRLRITGQLIDAETGAHIWAGKYDGEVGDVFALQDKVTGSVAAAIEPRVVQAEIARAIRRPTSKPAAYDYCLRARQLVLTPTQRTLGVAEDLLRSATGIDPGYAQAWALMALCANNRYVGGFDEDGARAAHDAVEHAQKAVACDSNDAEVLAVAAYMLASLGNEHEEASELIDRALELNPYSGSVCTFGGWVRICCGDFAGATELFRTALALDPLSPHGMSAFLGMAAGCFHDRRYAEAASWAKRALRRNPELTAAYRYMAASLAHQGKLGEARDMVTRLLSLQPNSSMRRSRLNTFRPDGMLDHYLEGLKLAGLPE
jgi:TolB-like protein